jgi:hypothetical protein
MSKFLANRVLLVITRSLIPWNRSPLRVTRDWLESKTRASSAAHWNLSAFLEMSKFLANCVLLVITGSLIHWNRSPLKMSRDWLESKTPAFKMLIEIYLHSSKCRNSWQIVFCWWFHEG